MHASSPILVGAAQACLVPEGSGGDVGGVTDAVASDFAATDGAATDGAATDGAAADGAALP